MILLNDLKAQHDSIKEELERAINSVISKSQFIGGEALDEFEENFSNYCQKGHCIGTSSGTSALYTVLKCSGIKSGDEVIVPVHTFIATAFAVSLLGAKPVFADVNENDFLINADFIENKITPKTKAIIPVHLYGNVCDMEKIKLTAEKYNLKIIEDCAQAHGSAYKGIPVPITDIGCFSFYPAKNLGALGDAGAIVTSSKELAEKCRKFINHGRKDKYLHISEGFNFRLDNLQAAILDVKLKYLESWINKKRSIANQYNKELMNSIAVPFVDEAVKHSYHLYVIKSKNRDALKKHLEINGIETGIHYPLPLHLQPALSYLGYKKGDFPVAESLAEQILSIPMYPFLKDEEQDKIISAINNFSN